jgi:hypothetical protein
MRPEGIGTPMKRVEVVLAAHGQDGRGGVEGDRPDLRRVIASARTFNRGSGQEGMSLPALGSYIGKEMGR